MDPASVTQLAYSHLSINNHPRHPLRDSPEAISSSCRVSLWCAPAFGEALLRLSLAAEQVFRRGCPRRAFRPSSARPVGAAKAALSPVVEVNGIEPMTSCLQSRRSPD
jgi:hypothetical protein